MDALQFPMIPPQVNGATKEGQPESDWFDWFPMIPPQVNGATANFMSLIETSHDRLCFQ